MFLNLVYLVSNVNGIIIAFLPKKLQSCTNAKVLRFGMDPTNQMPQLIGIQQQCTKQVTS